MTRVALLLMLLALPACDSLLGAMTEPLIGIATDLAGSVSRSIQDAPQ